MLGKYDILKRFEEWETKCIMKTEKKFQNELMQFKDSFNTLCYAFSEILKSQPAKDELLRHSGKNYAIATINGKELEKAVTSCNPFSELLKNALLAAGRC